MTDDITDRGSEDRADEGAADDEPEFRGAGISRRTFVRLSAATGAALALPGNATAGVTSEKFDAEYEYVQNHTPLDYAVPTLVTFADAAGPEAAADAVDAEFVTTSEPRPAAYGKLTAPQAATVADLPTAEELSHSPGSNPFWRLGYYPFGVFPEPHRSAEFIDYEQMVDGMEHLAAEYGDGGGGKSQDVGMNFYSVGKSPGHYNHVSARNDPKDLYVVELTNNIDHEESFREKTKVMYSLSMHGLERAGAEAGSRLIEAVLRGDERVNDLEPLLDELVLLFVYPNPDGWVAKHPQYESGWQLVGPDRGVPVAPFYERGNAQVFDTNRQYPTVGWIDPAEYPAEPTGANLVDDDPGVDGDVPAAVRDAVPDTLSFVEHFRSYENLEYGADLHGALWLSEFVLGLISQHQFTNRQYHELYAMSQAVDDELEAALQTWTTAGDVKDTLVGDRNVKALYETLPEEAFDYSGVWDTIGYTDAGFFGDWMAHPEELGGLGLTSMDFEMAYSHMVGANVYDPELVRMQVVGYFAAIRAIANFATRDVESVVETDGDSVAYVTTDALQRSYDDLSFVRNPSEIRTVQTHDYSGIVGPGGPGTTRAEHTFTAPDGAVQVQATCTWAENVQDLDFFLEDSSGNRVASSTNFGGPEELFADVDGGGEYTYVVETYASVAANYEITGEVKGTGSGTRHESESLTLAVLPGAANTASHRVASGTDTLSVQIASAPGTTFAAELTDPDGETVRSFDPTAAERGDAVGFPRFVVNDPDAGEWTLSVTGLDDAEGKVNVHVGTLASDGNPDPSLVIGYDQRDYGTVDPLRFFEDFAVAADGDVDPIPVEKVKPNKLSKYDHVVVIHDDGIDDDAYVAALDEYVESGGNLVLTDTGVHLLGRMENQLVGSVKPDDVVDEELYIGYIGSAPSDVDVTGGESVAKNQDHPLLEGTRPIQKQLYKIVPLGYNVGEQAPMTNVRPSAVEDANDDVTVASVAGTVEGSGASGNVGAASFTWRTEGQADDPGDGIHVVGGLLPPANQGNLHPFGLLDYTTSFFGELILTNAIDGRQVRYVDGEPVAVFGETDSFDVSE